MIVVGLKSDDKEQHIMYTKKRKKLNFNINAQSRGDKLIQKLQQEKQRKVLNNDHRIKSWISDATWILINSKAEARRMGNTTETKRLKKLVQKALRQDRKIRAENAAEEIETLLMSGNTREAYSIIQKWYKTTTNKPYIPTYMEAETTRKEYQDLYTQQQPEKDNIALDRKSVV